MNNDEKELNELEEDVISFLTEGPKSVDETYDFYEHYTKHPSPVKRSNFIRLLFTMEERGLICCNRATYFIFPTTVKGSILTRFVNGPISKTVFDLMSKVSQDIPSLTLADFFEELDQMKNKFEILHNIEYVDDCDYFLECHTWQLNRKRIKMFN